MPIISADLSEEAYRGFLLFKGAEGCKSNTEAIEKAVNYAADKARADLKKG